jgi:hypothetical protein
MTRTSNLEDFIPHREPITLDDLAAALADLHPVATFLALSVPLPYTRREDGTVDTIEVGPFNPSDEWMVYTGRDYRGDGFGNITAHVATCPGHMVVLVVRALYAHLTAAGPKATTGILEGDILYALGLARGGIEL